MILDKKTHYLQVALNGSLRGAMEIIHQLPVDRRIILEAGTPFIKTYGEMGIRSVVDWWSTKAFASGHFPYVVADMKCQDRGSTEVGIAKRAGASAITVNGHAPVETIDSLISECEMAEIDSMVDMMNVEQPFRVLRELKKLPTVVMLHRGVDEEVFNRDKPVPYNQINKIRASFDVLIAVAGGDTVREVQRAIFNDADIVVVWKEFYESGAKTAELASEFLRQIK